MTTYDGEAFVRDLDEVIGELKGFAIQQPLPSFHKADTFYLAMSKVMLALVVRKMEPTTLAERSADVFADARAMLIAKNAAYGDSALNPVRIFSSSSPMEQLLVRLDDKVSRIERGEAAGEDVLADMLGYMILVLIAKKRESRP